MKLVIDRRILSLSTLDSGVITPMMAVAHRFKEPGRYEVQVLQGDDQVAGFSLVVDTGAPHDPVPIDLGDIQCPIIVVSPETQVLFRAPRAQSGYTVVVERTDAEGRSTLFDTRRLEGGDIFMAVLLRPGRYIATDEGGTSCEIAVTPPGKEMVRYIPSRKEGVISGGAPLSITYGPDGFRPGEVEARSFQSLTFMIEAPARIRIAFESEP